MILWLIIGLMAAGALVFLAWPLFAAAPPADAAFDELDYLAAQIDDVDRERAIGVLSDEDAETARLEAKRRLLAAGRAEKKTRPPGAPAIAANLRQGALMGVGAIPLAAIALYLGIGASDQISLTNPNEQAVNATEIENPHQRPVGDLATDLEKRLKADPDNLDGWVELAETYASMSRFDDSAIAFGKAVNLSPNDPFLHAARGEAITLAHNGEITEDAKAEIDNALHLDKKEPRARFYNAEYAYQQGDKESAMKKLAALVNDADDKAQWLPIVQNELVSIAMELKSSLSEAGVTPAAQKRLKNMMEQEVAARDEVKGTASAPASAANAQDISALEAAVNSGNAAYTDWINLADQYAAQNDMDKANDVLARAEQRYAGAPFVLQQIKAAEARLSGGSSTPGPSANDIAAAQSMTDEQRQQMIKGMVAGLAAKLENNPNDAEGWSMLGRSYSVLGDLKGSAGAFAHAAELKPDDVSTQLSYAQALIAQTAAANANVDSKTKDVLNRVLKLDAEQPFALYYLGLAAEQQNDKDAARRYWTRLAGALPAGSDDLKKVQDQLDKLGD